MIKIASIFVSLSLCILLGGCRADFSFEPARGSIKGILKDNNGKRLEGITIIATYTTPSQRDENVVSKTTQSNANGRFMLEDLQGQVQLSVQTPRFIPVNQLIDLNLTEEPLLNLNLTGSPTIQGVDLNKRELSSSMPDSIFVRIETEDLYNTEITGYKGYILVQHPSLGTETPFPAFELFREDKSVVLSGNIQGSELNPGSYEVVVEVYDPDGNKHELRTPQTITVQ